MSRVGSMRALGNPNILNKRVPQNPKYKNVKSKLDTGSSLTKYMERLEDMRTNYRYRPGELFKRMKITTFAQIVLQVASLTEDPTLEEIMQMEGPSCPQTDRLDTPSGGDAVVATARSTLQSVISGLGEMDLTGTNGSAEKQQPLSPSRQQKRSEASEDQPYPDCPYLLMDLRDRDAYEQCHIIGAASYPSAMLSRSFNQYTKEMLEYKNVTGKIIIVYDEDERIATVAATTMCERGFENLYVLSGGLKVLAQKFPTGLTTGSLPPQLLAPPNRKARPSRPSNSSTSPVTPVVPDSPVSAGNKQRFGYDELERIRHYLDDGFTLSDTSSQFSRASTSRSLGSATSSKAPSTAGSISARSLISSAGTVKPWK
ncbi:centrosomal protein of 41 kDa [Petromyzon marinus]|uniref:Centrosomal protein of 41 kDa n=1 Tax=Petromyzon marinus TaxID=7757 RepID=A0AAJ7U3R9_PETMA|nr:centrosomal protein of 41 kDa [Petromyzon marinus]